MGKQVSEQIVREAPEIEAYKIGLLEAGKKLTETPLTLPGYQVAGLTETQQQAADLARQGIGSYAGFLQAGQGALQQGIGMLGGAVGPASQEQLQAYMNPYQELVTQKAIAEMQRQGNIARQGAASQAVRAGAFGGTREGVQRAELERGLQDIMSQRIAQDLAQNYGQAQTLYGQQQQRALQAGQLYGTLGVQQAALGEAAQRMGLQDVSTLMSLGQQEQQLRQAELDAARANELQASLTPFQQLSFLSDIYKGAPSTSMSLTASSAPSTSPLLQAAGLGIAGLSATAGAKKAGLF